VSSLVLSLGQVQPEQLPLVGRKAGALAELMAFGFPVPSGLCLTTTAFSLAIAERSEAIQSTLTGYDLSNPGAAQAASDAIAQLLDDLAVPDSVWSALIETGGELLHMPLAVRSSSTAEDRADLSFAGQYETVLDVHGEDALRAAILTCWKSYFEPNALLMRAAAPGDDDSMALLLQPMIQAECAGVCFSLDPVQPEQNNMVINAAWGLGSGVVDGNAPSDSIWLSRSNNEITRLVIAANCLPEAWAKRIAQFSRAAEIAFGAPQDVEWAIADQRVWILQSRPITALPENVLQRVRFPVEWSRETWEISGEDQTDYPPLLPLEQDELLVREGMREETCRFMGAERNQETRFFNGRAYSRRIPLNMSDGDKRIRRQAAADLKDRLHEQGLTSWDYWGPEVVKTTERLRQFDPQNADGPALADHLEDALAARRRHYMIHPMCWFNPHPAYFTAYEQLSGSNSEEAAYQLLDGEETPLTQLMDALHDLAHERITLDDLLNQFGERTGDGWGSEVTIATPTWREKPDDVLQLLPAYRLMESPRISRELARQKREGHLKVHYSHCDNDAVIETFQRELAHARRCLAVLEIHNHYIDQMASGQLRHAVIHAAHWLVKQGVLAQADDILWLRFDEILSALHSPRQFTDEIAERQAQHAAWQLMQAPPFLGMPDAQLPERPPQTDTPTVETQPRDGQLTGIGASPGLVQGRAFVATGKHVDLTSLSQGDVLIAVNVGPRWTLAFPLLGGLVLDSGAVGQHAAATAREYGIPAVVGTRFATQYIRNGTAVVVDGITGKVDYEL
jgi:phosphohistidine swiveling domain-containing protein